MSAQLTLGTGAHPWSVAVTSLAVGDCYYIPDAEHHYDGVIYRKVERVGWSGQADAVIAWIHPRIAAATGWAIGHAFGIGTSVSVVVVSDDVRLSV